MSNNLTLKIQKQIKESRTAKKEADKARLLKQERKEQARRTFLSRKPGTNQWEEVDAETLDPAYVQGLEKSVSADVEVNASGIKLKIKKPVANNKAVKLERLHKVIARAGITSVRKAEELIMQGRVSVDGSIASVGQQVNINDRNLKIRVDGNIIPFYLANKQPCRVLIYNKAEGEISTRSDPQGRATVFERLPRLSVGRWVQVGRLDANTTGILLFTNDGELAHRLMHPSYEIERKYICRVYGQVTDQILENLTAGVELEDGLAKFKSIRPLNNDNEKESRSNAWFEVTLNEGRNHEVRRLWESQDLVVSRLIRNEYAGICLNRELSVPASGYLEADLNEINMLRGLVGLPPEKEGFRPGSYGQSKSELKRQKHKLLKEIRGAIRKDKSHRPERGRVYDEKTQDKRDQRAALVNKISQSNKEKFTKGGKPAGKSFAGKAGKYHASQGSRNIKLVAKFK